MDIFDAPAARYEVEDRKASKAARGISAEPVRRAGHSERDRTPEQCVVNRSVKRDENHAPLCAFLRSIGWWYRDCSAYGKLGFDILTRHREGFPVMVEFKKPGPPSCRELTESEETLRDALPGFYRVVQTQDELCAAVGLAIQART